MDWLIVFFRAVHVPAAIIWAGGAAFNTFYLEPTVGKLGLDAEKVLNEFLRRRMSTYFAIAATLTVVGGAVLYVKDAGGLQLWLSTTSGVVFTIGAAAGIIAWAIGASFIPGTTKKLQGLIAELKAAGGPPSADLAARLHATQERLKMVSQVSFALVVIAIFAMATARYWG